MLNILFQDSHLLAVNKPSGTLSVPGKIAQQSLFEQVLSAFPNARVIHRLDMSTSGVILFALNHEAQKHLGKQFEKRNIRKSYVAVVDGIIERDSGEVNAPLICDWPNRPKQKIDWENGKPALTQFRVTERRQTLAQSCVQLTPITGRSHQLRVHMQHLGHAILGDALYASDKVKNQATRLLLHATSIEFTHPSEGTPLKIDCAAEF